MVYSVWDELYRATLIHLRHKIYMVYSVWDELYIPALIYLRHNIYGI